MPTKLEANASFMKPRFVFLVLAVALVLCAFVGGVSGADTWYIPNDNGLTLAQVVTNAADGDTIVITENYVIDKQVVLSGKKTGSGRNQKYETKTITIRNAPGVDVIVSSNLGELSSSDNTVVDTRTLFKIHAGTLIVKGNDEGGSLSFTSDYKGCIFDVNFDDIKSGNENDGVGATLVMYDGVRVYKSGFITENIAQSNNGGSVYIRSQGQFIMHGGLLTDNKAGGGGAVCVDNGGYFELNGGLITNNNALYKKDNNYQKWGGGVWVYDGNQANLKNLVNWTGGEIKGNTAMAQSPNGKDYNEIYPEIEPPVKKEVSPIYVSAGSTTYDDYWSIKEAYDDMKSKNVKTFTIYIRRDFSQGYIEKWQNNAYVTELDKVTIDKDYSVTIKPDQASVTLNLMFDQMFIVSSGGSLTVSGNNGASLTISGKNEVNTVETGGFALVNGGSLTVQDGVTISSAKAKNGGAIYLKSGSCTLSGSSKITGCAASEKVGAVYVDDGTFTVKGSASVDASNDVYLEDGEVITAESGYKGTVGKITMPSYEEGTKVVNVKKDSTGYPNPFTLTADSKDEFGEKILVLETGNPNHLVISINPNYKITIPPNLIVNSDEMEYIVATILEIPKNARVDVRINGDFGLDYVSGPDDLVVAPLSYDVLTNGRKVTNNDIIATFSMAQKDDVPLNAVCTDSSPYAGNYEDKLTFTFVYVSGETGNTR